MPATRVARWDGSAWSAVGDGFADGVVWGLQVFDDGSGPALLAFGTFTASGANPVSKAARWTGTAWEPLDGGADGTAFHSTVFNDGSGTSLYVGGGFATIGGVAASRVSRLSACEPPPCPADIDDSGAVAFGDILAILSAWGNICGPEDLDGSGSVAFGDLLVVLGALGPCPE